MSSNDCLNNYLTSCSTTVDLQFETKLCFTLFRFGRTTGSTTKSSNNRLNNKHSRTNYSTINVVVEQLTQE
ncbi:unnamed protein product [Rotaria magnacalcarata]|uniref:Uncharacterized protein n=1 Tax=Rotaria magnacalcarata TaxID=392030 RepID=A0A819WV38_9BILA|nr:unnamed protein product [Rotaria magnacalcarata]